MFRRKASVVRGDPTQHFPINVHISDGWGLKNLVPAFDPNVDYTQHELHLMAEKILIEDPKPPWEEPVFLPVSALLGRLRKEIYCGAGTPDAALMEGLYWRTHPDGRGWHTPEEMKERSEGFYK
jgi:hypothetical protein